MTFEFLWSDSVVYDRLLLSKYYPLYKLWAFFHQSIWEQRTVYAIAAPTSHSVTHAYSYFSYEKCIFTGSSRCLSNLIWISHEDELFVVWQVGFRLMSPESDSLRVISIVLRCHRAQINITNILCRIITLSTGTAVIDAVPVLCSLGPKVSSLLRRIERLPLTSGGIIWGRICVCLIGILLIYL